MTKKKPSRASDFPLFIGKEEHRTHGKGYFTPPVCQVKRTVIFQVCFYSAEIDYKKDEMEFTVNPEIIAMFFINAKERDRTVIALKKSGILIFLSKHNLERNGKN